MNHFIAAMDEAYAGPPLRKYSEDQARDEQGRFSGGGESGRAAERASSQAEHDAAISYHAAAAEHYYREATKAGEGVTRGGPLTDAAEAHEIAANIHEEAKLGMRSSGDARAQSAHAHYTARDAKARQDRAAARSAFHSRLAERVEERGWSAGVGTGPRGDSGKKFLEAFLLKYSEDQARDEQGRFSGGSEQGFAERASEDSQHRGAAEYHQQRAREEHNRGNQSASKLHYRAAHAHNEAASYRSEQNSRVARESSVRAHVHERAQERRQQQLREWRYNTQAQLGRRS